MVAQNRPLPAAVVPPPAVAPTPHAGGRLKRATDLGLGLVLLVVAAPAIAAAWVLVRLSSPGPGFYSQVRVGRGGRHYRIYKIRTMRHNCEAGSGARWATKGDSRITPVGRLFRKLHIDELPQLWNVVRGDMSLVGPRPERPEFVGPLGAEIPGYAERHAVRPGVTGLAQIQLPADTDVESVRTKLVLDRCYIREASFWLDVRIMLGTLVYLLGFSYARVRRLLRLPNPLADKPPAQKPADETKVHRALGAGRGDDTVTKTPLAVERAEVPASEAR